MTELILISLTVLAIFALGTLITCAAIASSLRLLP